MSHWRLAAEKCSVACALGNPMLMTVASKATINCTRLSVASTHHRPRCEEGAPSIVMPNSLKNPLLARRHWHRMPFQ